MFKWIRGTVGLLLLCVSVSAQKNDFNLSGYWGAGLAANLTDETATMVNTDFKVNRLRLNASFGNPLYGIKTRVHFQSRKNWGLNSVAVQNSQTNSIAVQNVQGLSNPQLWYAYGYMHFLDGVAEMQAGALFENPFGANNLGYGMYGNGINLLLHPIEELSIGAIAYASYFQTSSLSCDFDSYYPYRYVCYGVAYKDKDAGLDFRLGWGAEPNSGQGDTLLSFVKLTPMEQFSIALESYVFNTFGLDDERRTLRSLLSTSFKCGIVTVMAGVAELSLFGDGKPSERTTFFECRTMVSLMSGISADLGGGVSSKENFFIRPGFIYTPAANLSAGIHYAYMDGYTNFDRWVTVIGTSEGHEVQFDFTWYF